VTLVKTRQYSVMMSCETVSAVMQVTICADQNGSYLWHVSFFFTFVSWRPSLSTPVTDLWMLMSFLGVLVENIWVVEDSDQ